MFADLLLIAAKAVIVLVFVAFVVYNLMPGTKFIKKHGRSNQESDKPFE